MQSVCTASVLSCSQNSCLLLLPPAELLHILSVHDALPIVPCSSLVHTFKHAFRPSVRHVSDGSSSSSQGGPTTHITLHLSQLLPGLTYEPDCMEIDEPEPGPWPPVGTHLGHLPSHLVSCNATHYPWHPPELFRHRVMACRTCSPPGCLWLWHLQADWSVHCTVFPVTSTLVCFLPLPLPPRATHQCSAIVVPCSLPPLLSWRHLRRGRPSARHPRGALTSCPPCWPAHPRLLRRRLLSSSSNKQLLMAMLRMMTCQHWSENGWVPDWASTSLTCTVLQPL